METNTRPLSCPDLRAPSGAAEAKTPRNHPYQLTLEAYLRSPAPGGRPQTDYHRQTRWFADLDAVIGVAVPSTYGHKGLLLCPLPRQLPSNARIAHWSDPDVSSARLSVSRALEPHERRQSQAPCRWRLTIQRQRGQLDRLVLLWWDAAACDGLPAGELDLAVSLRHIAGPSAGSILPPADVIDADLRRLLKLWVLVGPSAPDEAAPWLPDAVHPDTEWDVL